ncbi:laccase, multicopper oxidase, benzenediol:oxygen oxidorectuctase [Marasmius sp. AFHP31]|nr:laccase, multicopper oxidase, benzenediol:oxygen oxidorectuctase [Marasmius sp. AFHP31]
MARLYSLLSYVLLAVLGANAAHIGPTADLVISNGVVSPDGFSRSAVLAGGTTIGPVIIGNKGESLKVNVVNQLNDPSMLQSTSIHWHGFFQEHTNWADGPAFVNQCPIPKGTSFLYDFPTRNQAGTFWYHSHLSTQYCDGLRGAIVVYDPQDPHAHLYDVDDDSTVITLADWYHAKAKTLVDPTPDTTLINGLGRHKGGPASELAVIQVQQGKRYRMRLVNVACQPDYEFSIDKHAMTIIEADSISHEPLEVDSLRIFVGQRYSFVLNANQPVGNYCESGMKADPSDGDGGFNGGINSAILRYVGAPAAEPAKNLAESGKPRGREMNEADLHPIASENPGAPGLPFPGGVDHAVNLHLSTSSGKFMFNDVSYVSPTLPVLLQVLSGARAPGDLLPKGSVYELPANATIEVSFSGGGVKGFEHPIHLHGHAFDVVRVAGSKQYNYANPVRRDVVNSGKGGDNVTFRFRTDNPGPWFLHCHIDWHLELGLAVVFAERTTEWKENISPPAAWDELCPEYNAMDPKDL